MMHREISKFSRLSESVLEEKDAIKKRREMAKFNLDSTRLNLDPESLDELRMGQNIRAVPEDFVYRTVYICCTFVAEAN